MTSDTITLASSAAKPPRYPAEALLQGLSYAIVRDGHLVQVGIVTRGETTTRADFCYGPFSQEFTEAVRSRIDCFFESEGQGPGEDELVAGSANARRVAA